MMRCPNCGEAVPEGGRGLGRTFCSTRCKDAWHSRSKGEGAVVIGPLKAWMANRNAKPGTPEAAVASRARTEVTRIVAAFLEEDRQAGRPNPAEWAARHFDSGRTWQDRARR